MTGQAPPLGLHKCWLGSSGQREEIQDDIAASAGIRYVGRKFESVEDTAEEPQLYRELREEVEP